MSAQLYRGNLCFAQCANRAQNGLQCRRALKSLHPLLMRSRCVDNTPRLCHPLWAKITLGKILWGSVQTSCQSDCAKEHIGRRFSWAG